MLIYKSKRGTHHTLLLATTEGEPFAANTGKISLRKLPKVFFKFTRFDSLVIQILVEMRVPYYVVPNGLILGTVSHESLQS